MITVPAYVELLATRGVSLDELGLREVALRREDAVIGLGMLRRQSIPMLGGDVYAICNGHMKYAYASWSCERAEHDEQDGPGQYAERGYQKSKQYMESYPQREAEVPVLVLVIPIHLPMARPR